MKLPKLKIDKAEAVQTLDSTTGVVRDGFKLIGGNPTILIYPKIASWVVFPVSGLLLGLTYWLVNHPFKIGSHSLSVLLTTSILSYVYTGFLNSYFTCAIVAAALSNLEGRQEMPVIGQMRQIKRKFWRITKFGLTAFLYPVISIYARRKELRKNFIFVIGGAFSLSVATLAPAIMDKDTSITESVRWMNQTLGQAWRQNLLLKVGRYSIFFLIGFLAFLPKLAQHYWFDSHSAHIVGWVVAAGLWLISFVLIQLFSSIFTAVLYHKVTHYKL